MNENQDTSRILEEANQLLNENPMPEQPEVPVLPKKKRRTALHVFLRTLLVLLTVVVLVLSATCVMLHHIFFGPSLAARDALTMSLIRSSGTWWIPAVFLGQDLTDQIVNGDPTLLPSDDSGEIPIIIPDSSLGGEKEEWKDHPDGIRFETVYGDTYTAHVMIVRDPSRVYLATSSPHFSPDILGGRLTDIMESTGAAAGINGGAFFDDATNSPKVGATPCGMVVSGGKIVWNDNDSRNSMGFAGFTEDNVLVVVNKITEQKVKDLKIRDGCCFGPILLSDGKINQQAYNKESGFNPRTAIGQRQDGAVVMVCIDGRQLGNLGGGFKDMVDIMVEYEAVNACNLDGGSSSIMMYRDQYGIFGEKNQVVAVNNYSSLRAKPRRMPTFFLVKP